MLDFVLRFLRGFAFFSLRPAGLWTPLALLLMSAIVVLVAFNFDDAELLGKTLALLPWASICVTVYYLAAVLLTITFVEGGPAIERIGANPSAKLFALYAIGLIVVSVVFLITLYVIAIKNPNLFSPPLPILPDVPGQPIDPSQLRAAWPLLIAYWLDLASRGAFGDIVEHFHWRFDQITLRTWVGLDSVVLELNPKESWLFWCYTFLYRTFCGLLSLRIVWQLFSALRRRLERGDA